jgi:radical SAM protein with 4Fe4S-binding SPASM domain
MIKCKALTHGVVVRNSGALVPCCVFIPDKEWNANVNNIVSVEDYRNSPQLQQLQYNLDHDIKDKQCKACWRLEDTESDSWRGMLNSQLHGEETLVEIRLGNVCNFRCYTCGPNSSSKIQADYTKLGIPFVAFDDWTKQDNSVALVNEFLSTASRVSILGGEPFYNKNFDKYLNVLRENKAIKEISITTNGSMVPFDKLEGIANLVLTFSIDAVGELSEYVRHDSTWSVVKANFEESIKRGIRTHAGLTLSLYNLFGLPETLEYLHSQNPAHIHFNFVDNPDFMSIECLPPCLLEDALEMLHGLDIDDANIEHAILSVGKNYTPAQLKKFIDYTKRFDNLRGTKLTSIAPQFSAIM